jgi:hypothetical protein
MYVANGAYALAAALGLPAVIFQAEVKYYQRDVAPHNS